MMLYHLWIGVDRIQAIAFEHTDHALNILHFHQFDGVLTLQWLPGFSGKPAHDSYPLDR